LIDKDSDEKLTIQEFIESYVVLEEKLRMKKISLSKLDEELRVTKEKFYKGMTEHKGEKTNQEDLMDNASLSVTLLDAKGLRPMNFKGTSDPYVVLTFGSKKATSAYRPGTLKPAWNEDFSFHVTNKKVVLDITVWHRDTFSDGKLGSISIPLSDLEDQIKIEKEYDLTLNGEETEGKLRLRMQFLYSRYKYFSDNHVKTEQQIQRLQEDITQLNKYFELFEKPFGILIYGEIDSILDRRILQRSDDLASYAASNRRSIYMTSPAMAKMTPKSLAYKLESVIKGTLSKIS
jgi:Ca2+-dependent lipid-binding protein